MDRKSDAIRICLTSHYIEIYVQFISLLFVTNMLYLNMDIYVFTILLSKLEVIFEYLTYLYLLH